MRILAWIFIFINNSRKVKNSGSLTTEEIERRRKYLIKQAQREVEYSEKFIDNQRDLIYIKIRREYNNAEVELKEYIHSRYPQNQY